MTPPPPLPPTKPIDCRHPVLNPGLDTAAFQVQATCARLQCSLKSHSFMHRGHAGHLASRASQVSRCVRRASFPDSTFEQPSSGHGTRLDRIASSRMGLNPNSSRGTAWRQVGHGTFPWSEAVEGTLVKQGEQIKCPKRHCRMFPRHWTRSKRQTEHSIDRASTLSSTRAMRFLELGASAASSAAAAACSA